MSEWEGTRHEIPTHKNIGQPTIALSVKSWGSDDWRLMVASPEIFISIEVRDAEVLHKSLVEMAAELRTELDARKAVAK